MKRSILVERYWMCGLALLVGTGATAQNGPLAARQQTVLQGKVTLERQEDDQENANYNHVRALIQEEHTRNRTEYNKSLQGAQSASSRKAAYDAFEQREVETNKKQAEADGQHQINIIAIHDRIWNAVGNGVNQIGNGGQANSNGAAQADPRLRFGQGFMGQLAARERAGLMTQPLAALLSRVQRLGIAAKVASMAARAGSMNQLLQDLNLQPRPDEDPQAFGERAANVLYDLKNVYTSFRPQFNGGTSQNPRGGPNGGGGVRTPAGQRTPGGGGSDETPSGPGGGSQGPGGGSQAPGGPGGGDRNPQQQPITWNDGGLAPNIARNVLAKFLQGQIGNSVRTFSLQGKSLRQIEREIAGPGGWRVNAGNGTVKSSDGQWERTEVQVNTSGSGTPLAQPYRMIFYENRDGGVVRLKPDGDPNAQMAHMNQPHGAMFVKTDPSAGPDWNNEAFKVFNGYAVPKTASDTVKDIYNIRIILPPGITPGSDEAKAFMEEFISRTWRGQTHIPISQ